MTDRVLTLGAIDAVSLANLLRRFGVTLQVLDAKRLIPATFWGEPEAGVVGTCVYARPDTPVHSILHEACHIVCMDGSRRAELVRDAGGDDLEEAAVCYLQIVLAGALHSIGRTRLMQDMDNWGYSFRLGNTARWFYDDAGDARAWLCREGLLDRAGKPRYRCRR